MLKQIQTIWMLLAVTIFLSSGCTTHTRIQNKTLESTNPNKNHHAEYKAYSDLGDIFLALSFSGGGTRAAAFSYGLLSELRDTQISLNGFNIRLLDEIDHISSVSGGSFTAAYYGLFGEQIFNDFETVFLRKNVQKSLMGSVLNPLNWFSLLSSDFDRSTLAFEYYDKHIFRGRTFGDMMSRKGPFIHINATDLITGQPFSFTPESFALLCSDLSDFKVAMAVTASSAVPVVFPPITLKNHSGCDIDIPKAVEAIQHDTTKDIRLQVLSKNISSYLDKDRRKYIHLVDGGISDNLGVRSMLSRMFLINKVKQELELPKVDSVKSPKHFVMIVVNAQTKNIESMEQSPDSLSGPQVMNAISSTHISQSNLETISQAKKLFKNAVKMISSKKGIVNGHFIELKFDDIPDLKTRKIFNNMATSFTLPDDQVDMLYESARKLLRESKEFQKFLKALKQ